MFYAQIKPVMVFSRPNIPNSNSNYVLKVFADIDENRLH